LGVQSGTEPQSSSQALQPSSSTSHQLSPQQMYSSSAQEVDG
jgi:hypothetical protein